jgi:2',3'-cyclic-nucleotide 2'-phosphodiesterase (5'-nucleotidase family)
MQLMGGERRSFLKGIVAGGFLAVLGQEGFAQSGSAPLEITFLHVNDVYQHAPQDGQGGLAELATLIDRERAEARGPVFFTFGGDLISPSLASSETKGRHMIELFNALGPDAAVLGNHEFDFGPEIAAQRIADSSFPWLAANVKGPDGQPFGGTKATLLKAAGGLSVGFVGVLTADTARLSQAAGVVFDAELPALRQAVAALRAQGASLVVALTHLDLAEDRRAAHEVPGLDLILGGHDHEPSTLQEGRVLLVKAGSDARWLAKVRLTVQPPAEPGARAHVHSMGWEFIPNVRVEPSPRLAPMVAAIEARLNQDLSQPLARLEAPLDSRVAVVRQQEAAIGNLFADALRAHFDAQVALINGGGFRGNREYPTGYGFTRRDLLSEVPFGNAVTLLDLSGAELLQALENGLSEAEGESGRFPQVSGVRLTYSLAKPAGSRIEQVLVGDAPLDPARRYTLATTDYLAAGKDGYDVLHRARVRVDSSGGPLLVNVVAEAMTRSGARTAVEGRVRAN